MARAVPRRWIRSASGIVNTVDVSLVQDGVTADYSASDVSFLDRAANLVVTKTDNLAEYRGSGRSQRGHRHRSAGRALVCCRTR